MDANGSLFQLLLGERDFGPMARASADLVFDDESATLTLRPEVPHFTPPGAEPLDPSTRLGADCDEFGNIYWIEEESLWVLPRGLDEAARYYAVEPEYETSDAVDGSFAAKVEAPATNPRFRGLAVTGLHYLVCGTLADQGPGLMVFDLHQGGAAEWLRWPQGSGFSPVDLVKLAGGGLAVLDSALDRHRYWILDRYLRVQGENAPASTPFAPCDPGDDAPPLERPTASGFDFAATRPVAIGALADGSVVVLDTPLGDAPSRLLWLSEGVVQGAFELSGSVVEGVVDVASVRGFDLICIDKSRADVSGLRGARIIVMDESGLQCFAFDLSESSAAPPTLTMTPEVLPTRRTTGKGLVRSGDRTLYDLGSSWIDLTELPRRRYPREASASHVFDGKSARTVWHRLMLDACIPERTEVQVATRAADDLRLLKATPFTNEPLPHRRPQGSELPLYATRSSVGARDGTWELLFQRAHGRFLEVRLTLRGDSARSPRIGAVRAYYPRFSYLEQYLPAAYRQDPPSADFLERFLCNFEGLHTELETRLLQTQLLFDPRTAPAEYLEWLAGWLGGHVESSWEEARKRLFLRYAHLLFKHRGSRGALVAAIRLATEPCVDDSIFDELMGRATSRAAGNGLRIVEGFQRRRFPGVVLGDPSVPEQPGRVLAQDRWEPSQGADPLHERFRRYLFARYAPAGALYDLSEVPESERTPTAQATVESSRSDALAALPWSNKPPLFEALRLSPVLPAEPEARASWRDFLDSGLGFRYAEISGAQLSNYQLFLKRRYRRPEKLAAAHGTELVAFEQVALPDEHEFPEGGPALSDWIAFATRTVPLREEAHRFTVLVPTSPQDDRTARALNVERVRRVVEREKPAHTAFDVRAYWELFRVGSARVGFDTTLGESSRYAAIIVGRDAVGDGFLAAAHPRGVRDRWVVGRDAPQHSESAAMA